MKKIILSFLSLLFILVVFQQCKKKDADDVDCSKVNAKYNADIRPLVAARCNTTGCHTSGYTNGDFTFYEGLKAAADNGTLANKVLDAKTMPPSGALSQDDRNKIKCWIDSGSPNN